MPFMRALLVMEVGRVRLTLTRARAAVKWTPIGTVLTNGRRERVVRLAGDRTCKGAEGIPLDALAPEPVGPLVGGKAYRSGANRIGCKVREPPGFRKCSWKTSPPRKFASAAAVATHEYAVELSMSVLSE